MPSMYSSVSLVLSFKLSSLFSYSMSLSNASLCCACVNSRLHFSSWFSLFTDLSSSLISGTISCTVAVNDLSSEAKSSLTTWKVTKLD